MAKTVKARQKKSDAPIELMSVNAFAKLVQVDESSIRDHIRKGSFPTGVVYDNKGVRKINKPAALKEWAACGGGNSRRTKYKMLTEARGDEDEGEDVDGFGPKGTKASQKRAEKHIEKAAEAKAKAEHYRAEILQLEYMELEKSLVRREDVYKEIFEKAVQLRQALLRIGGIVIDKIMICDDRTTNINTINDAIEAVLNQLTDEEIKEDEDDAEQ